MLITLYLASWVGLQRTVYCILPGQGALAAQYFSQIIMGYIQNNMHNGITRGHQIGSRNANITFRQWWFLSKHTQHWYSFFFLCPKSRTAGTELTWNEVSFLKPLHINVSEFHTFLKPSVRLHKESTCLDQHWLKKALQGLREVGETIKIYRRGNVITVSIHSQQVFYGQRQLYFNRNMSYPTLPLGLF